MDKKPGEELASTLDANPSEPIAPAAEPVAPAAEPVAPVAEPAPVAPAAEPIVNPAAAPAGAAPIAVAPVKKKKTGLIVGVTIAALAVAGGGTAAAILLLNNKGGTPEGDPGEIVNDMVADVITGSSASNVAYKGTASLSANGMSASLNFDGEIAGQEGKASFGIDFNGGGMEVSGSIDAIIKGSYAYLKINGVKDILSKLGLSAFLGSSASAIQDIDGTWYKLPVEISTSFDAYLPTTKNACNIDYSAILQDREAFASIYKENGFIKAEKYTGTDVAKKKGDLYKLSFDEEKLKSFAEELASRYGSGRCSVSVDTDSIKSIEEAATILAEFSGKEISRLYAFADKEGTSIKIDVDLSTPANVSIEAPAGAKSAEDLMETLAPIINMFGGSFGLGGGSFGGYGDDIDNCYKGSISTNCIDYDDDDYDDDYDDDDDDDDDNWSSLFDDDDWSSSYDDDYDLSELQDALDQLENYQDLLKDYDTSDLESALDALKNLQ